MDTYAYPDYLDRIQMKDTLSYTNFGSKNQDNQQILVL